MAASGAGGPDMEKSQASTKPDGPLGTQRSAGHWRSRSGGSAGIDEAFESTEIAKKEAAAIKDIFREAFAEEVSLGSLVASAATGVSFSNPSFPFVLRFGSGRRTSSHIEP